MTDREKAIKDLEDVIAIADGLKGLPSQYGGIIIDLDKIDSLRFALESLKADDYENEISDLHNRLDIAEYDKERLREEVTVLEEKLKALSAEPCDCISREEVCDYIAEFVNHEYATDRERELVKHIIGGIQHLPSIQPKTDVLDKIRAEIEFIPTIEWKDDGTTYILASYFKKQVLEIIDKCKAESEDKE